MYVCMSALSVSLPRKTMGVVCLFPCSLSSYALDLVAFEHEKENLSYSAIIFVIKIYACLYVLYILSSVRAHLRIIFRVFKKKIHYSIEEQQHGRKLFLL